MLQRDSRTCLLSYSSTILRLICNPTPSCALVLQFVSFHRVAFPSPRFTFFVLLYNRQYDHGRLSIRGRIDHCEKKDITSNVKNLYLTQRLYTNKFIPRTFSTYLVLCQQSYTERNIGRKYSRYLQPHKNKKVGVFSNSVKLALRSFGTAAAPTTSLGTTDLQSAYRSKHSSTPHLVVEMNFPSQ